MDTIKAKRQQRLAKAANTATIRYGCGDVFDYGTSHVRCGDDSASGARILCPRCFEELHAVVDSSRAFIDGGQ